MIDARKQNLLRKHTVINLALFDVKGTGGLVGRDQVGDLRGRSARVLGHAKAEVQGRFCWAALLLRFHSIDRESGRKVELNPQSTAWALL